MAQIRYCDKCGASCQSMTGWKLSLLTFKCYTTNTFGDPKATKNDNRLEREIEVCPDCRNDIIRAIEPAFTHSKFTATIPQETR